MITLEISLKKPKDFNEEKLYFDFKFSMLHIDYYGLKKFNKNPIHKDMN